MGALVMITLVVVALVMMVVAMLMIVVALVMVRDKCLAVDRSAPDSESGARSCGRCDLIGGLRNKRQNTWHMEEY